MRFICPFLISCVLLSFSLYSPLPAAEDDAVQLNSILLEAVKLGKDKKFDKAKEKLESLLPYWQFNARATLYNQVCIDYANEIINKKTAEEIYKALYEDINVKPKKALKNIKNAAKKNSAYYPVFIVQGEIYTNLEDYLKADESYAKAIELAPTAYLPLLFRGKYQSGIGNKREALVDFDAAIVAQPAAISYFERGYIHTLRNRYDEAISDFEAAIKQCPDWRNSTIVNEAYHNRGVQNMEKEDYKQAVGDFTIAIDINPDYLPSYLSRGMAYRNLRQYTSAMADFEHCIKADPKFAGAYYQMGFTSFKRRLYSKAIPDLKAAIQLEPRNTTFIFKLADTYYHLGEYDTAVSHFDKLLEIDANDCWAHYWRAYSLATLGKARLAIGSFEKFLAICPPNYQRQISSAKAEIKRLRRRSG